LGAQEKELLWIEESNQRFYAYNHFGQHPERLVGWFDQHMSGRRKLAVLRREYRKRFSEAAIPLSA
jgi:hypothetical protein